MFGQLLNTAYSGFMAGRRGAQAKAKYKEWENRDAAIPLDDPEQRSILNRLGTQERYYRAGTDANTAYANRLAANAGAQAQANLVRAGGPGVIQNLLSSQAVTSRQLGANAAIAADRANEMLGARNSLTTLMAERRYSRQKYRRDQALQEAQDYRDSANRFSQATVQGVGQIGDAALSSGSNMSGGAGGSF